MSLKRKSEKGFTLIELIIVIVILGIIAGIAVPKFIDLAGSAKTAAARGVGGALSSTIASKHANYLLENTSYNFGQVVTDTAFAGGISSTSFTDSTGGGSGTVSLDYKGTIFNWTYTGRNGETTAYLEEIGASTWGRLSVEVVDGIGR